MSKNPHAGGEDLATGADHEAVGLGAVVVVVGVVVLTVDGVFGGAGGWVDNFHARRVMEVAVAVTIVIRDVRLGGKLRSRPGQR